MKPRILMALLSTISWYACVSLANSSLEVFCFSILMLNYWSFRRLFPNLTWRNLWKPFLMGLCFDQLMISLGLIQIPTMPFVPFWLISLWGIFVMSLPLYQGVKWLRDQRKSFLIGAIGGILSYSAGSAWGILYFKSVLGYFVYGIFWGIFFATKKNWPWEMSSPEPTQ